MFWLPWRHHRPTPCLIPTQGGQATGETEAPQGERACRRGPAAALWLPQDGATWPRHMADPSDGQWSAMSLLCGFNSFRGSEPSKGRSNLQPSTSHLTLNPEPRFPKDDNAHPRAAAASARCTPPPDAPRTGISTVHWRTEIPGSPGLPEREQAEEMATHTGARLSAQNAVQLSPPARGPRDRGRAQGEPLQQLWPRSSGSSSSRSVVVPALSAPGKWPRP